MVEIPFFYSAPGDLVVLGASTDCFGLTILVIVQRAEGRSAKGSNCGLLYRIFVSAIALTLNPDRPGKFLGMKPEISRSFVFTINLFVLKLGRNGIHDFAYCLPLAVYVLFLVLSTPRSQRVLFLGNLSETGSGLLLSLSATSSCMPTQKQ